MRGNKKSFIYQARKSNLKHQQYTPFTPKENLFGAKFFIALTVFIVSSLLFWQRNFVKSNVVEIFNPTVTEKTPEIHTEPIGKIISHVIAEGDVPADIFAEYGKLDTNEIANLLVASEDVFDLTNLKVDKTIDFVFDEEEKLDKIAYYPTSERMVVAEVDGENFVVKKENIPYSIEEKTASVKIDEYLYKDALDAGLTENSILEIADIFSFDVDFTTEIREGDELKVVYQKRTLDGEDAPDGKVLAAKFINDGNSYFSYYFENGDEESGGHYDADGKELVRQFLRAPLSYRQITSGYTGARLHPITKTVSAHYQIDYAAPTGTPVVTTARGTVTSAGWENGWGNMVRIRHDNGYTTHYGHLSAYGKDIKTGVSVSQGQIVGYVGSTGWSTGPHLDYGMKLNGSPVDPMSLQLPKGEPLGGDMLEKFQREKEKYENALR
jgi:murein DD-endopeptidase MepM/ murein hydrolase activator NlpD